MVETRPPATVTLGSLRTRGDGTRAAAADAVQAVARGLEAGARQLGAAQRDGYVNLLSLRVRLPPGASPQEISRALELAVARVLKGKP
ncbi:MAG TPA: hypothetical protein VF601_23495 [Beijerinckiaceae bacterium]|jgi:hypothetical protein